MYLHTFVIISNHFHFILSGKNGTTVCQVLLEI